MYPGARDVEFRTRRAAALLARLALHPRLHSRESLCEMLWPRAAPRNARQSLSQLLSELRRVLGTPLIVARGDRVGLHGSRFRSDVAEFDQLRRRAERTTGATRASWQMRMLRIAHAPMLQGLDYDWAIAAREDATASCDAALRELAEFHAARRDLAAAFTCAWRRVRLDPYSEDAHRQIARLYALAGHTALAIDHLHDHARLLRQALEQAPDAATQALALTLRNELARLAGLGPSAAPPAAASPDGESDSESDQTVRAR